MRKLNTLLSGFILVFFLGTAFMQEANAQEFDPGTVESISSSDQNLKSAAVSETPADGLKSIYSVTGKYFLSADGIGSLSTSMNIDVLKPSAAATVHKAFLFSASYSGSIADGCVSVNGTNVIWDAGVINSFFKSYYADVTSLVATTLNAAPAGTIQLPITECSGGIDGEALLVIFNDPAATEKTVAIMFGGQALAGDNFSLALADPIDPSDPESILDMGLGISFGYQQYGGVQYSIVEVNSQRLSTSAGGEDDGYSSNGGLITVGGLGDSNANPASAFATPSNQYTDDELYSILPFVTNATTSVDVYTRNPSNDDNIFLAYFVISGEAAVVIEDNVWTGAVSTAWEDPANWSEGYVPTASDDAIIPVVPNLPYIAPSIAADCKNLVIKSGAKVTIGSDATNSGSLIVQEVSSGAVCYERYVSGGFMDAPEMWHLMGSPVAGQGINSLVTTPANDIAAKGLAYGVAPYDNSMPGWKCYTKPAGINPANAAGDFTSGVGFELLRAHDGLVTFCGELERGEVAVPMTVGSNAWNLLSNPYTAALAANDAAQIAKNLLAVNGGVLHPAYQALYVWDPVSSSYLIYAATDVDVKYIAPGQAFFVMANAPGNFVMNEEMLIHNTGNIFKSAKIEPSIVLFAEREGFETSTKIKYAQSASLGFDQGYDVGMFNGVEFSFALYSQLVEASAFQVDLGIQSVPADFGAEVPIGLNVKAGSTVNFRIEESHLPSEITVYLTDHLTGEVFNLSAGNCKVAFEEDFKGTGRFSLTTKSIALKDQFAEETNISILALPSADLVQISGIQTNGAYCIVYDLSGRTITTKSLLVDGVNNINVSLNKGAYIISVVAGDACTSKKVIWNK